MELSYLICLSYTLYNITGRSTKISKTITRLSNLLSKERLLYMKSKDDVHSILVARIKY